MRSTSGGNFSACAPKASRIASRAIVCASVETSATPIGPKAESIARIAPPVMRFARSYDAAGLAEREARAAPEHAGRIADADRADEVRLNVPLREKFLVHLLVVEAGHRSDVEPERPHRHHKIGALQRAVAERSGLDQRM